MVGARGKDALLKEIDPHIAAPEPSRDP
jgi:hypothetical protein